MPLDIKHLDRTALRRIIIERPPFAYALVRTGARALLKGVMTPTTAAPPDQPRAVARPDSTQLFEADRVVALVYELLDAHSDTTQLASELDFDQSWDAHLDYLRALQRTGREVLAEASAERPVPRAGG
jgi:hypothetical protein